MMTEVYLYFDYHYALIRDLTFGAKNTFLVSTISPLILNKISRCYF